MPRPIEPAGGGREGQPAQAQPPARIGAIEQDADVVMFIHREEFGLSREEARERDLVGKADLIVAKQRNGPVGDLKLLWREDHTCFENLAVQGHDEFAAYTSEDREF